LVGNALGSLRPGWSVDGGDVDVRDLHVTAKQPRAGRRFVNVSLRLDAGGPGARRSGSSTLTMAVLRLVPVGTTVTGSVTLAERGSVGDEARSAARRWAEAAVVFQGAQHVSTRASCLSRSEQSMCTRRQQVAELLEQVGIRAGAWVHIRGVVRRTNARDDTMALACDQLLIADEPTTALDVMVQAGAQLLEELQTLAWRSLATTSRCCRRCRPLAVMYRAAWSGRAGQGDAAVRASLHQRWHAFRPSVTRHLRCPVRASPTSQCRRVAPPRYPSQRKSARRPTSAPRALGGMGGGVSQAVSTRCYWCRRQGHTAAIAAACRTGH
jgi:predicted ABC-type transport system involved in lysophospholipase L1 biosynthesis ATPase subunit